MINITKNWLASPWIEFFFILMPPFFCLSIIGMFPLIFSQQSDVSAFWWMALVVLIDVSHVYSTLYRTYFHQIYRLQLKSYLFWIPFFSLACGIVLYAIGPMVFWRVMAYLAAYHFIRQQYGMMRIYTRQDKASKLENRIDLVCIYSCTIYPLLQWHLSGNKNFNWFMENDFILSHSPIVDSLFFILYVVVLSVYFIKEIKNSIFRQSLNLPKNLIVIGTGLSWYLGIVFWNGDLIFTFLNVICHGVPYMALIWIFGSKEKVKFNYTGLMKQVFSGWGWILFLLSLFVFAIIEEGFWDALVWNEHPQFFQAFYQFKIPNMDDLMVVVVPLLSLPQITHYLLDAFIWRIRSNTEIGIKG